MGLLEDAIREHLELKRLRGADPAQVAREQHEALDPPAGQDPGTQVEDQAATGEHGIDAPAHVLDGNAAATGNHPDDVPESPVASDSAHAAQETAELDMEAVMADELSTAGGDAVSVGSDLADGEAPSAEEDSLEWEVPARPSRENDSDPALHEGGNRDADAPEPDSYPPAPESAEEFEDGHKDGHSHPQRDAPGQGRLSL